MQEEVLAAARTSFHGIGNCSYSGGTPTKMPKAFLLGKCADIRLFHGIGNCCHSGGCQQKAKLFARAPAQAVPYFME
jgi:bacterioferritin-associated ferredoxin